MRFHRCTFALGATAFVVLSGPADAAVRAAGP
jgi:hypothetical protein